MCKNPYLIDYILKCYFTNISDYYFTGNGRGSDSEDDEPATKKGKPEITPGLLGNAPPGAPPILPPHMLPHPGMMAPGMMPGPPPHMMGQFHPMAPHMMGPMGPMGPMPPFMAGPPGYEV